jgi:ankyrin repeat protein
MSRQLSPKSSLDVLKHDAKRWLKSLRDADVEARRRLEAAWPAAPQVPTLRDVQHALAREYGLADWKSLIAALDDLALDRQSHAERVDAVLRHGWDGDRHVARRIVDRFPDVRRDSIFTAAACGEIDEVRRLLAANAARATAVGGPHQWTALTYVAYSRLDSEHAVDIARLLLEAGADPNFQFDDGWGNPFTAITGAIGQGEGVKPIHAQARALVELLITAGANPFDSQALYNTSIVRDDTYWTNLLYTHCERLGTTAIWSQLEGPVLNGPIKVGTLNYLLGNAVASNHLARAQWTLEHGADANTVHSYSGQRVHTQARLAGMRAMVELLERHGAREESLTGERAFLAALMAGDEADVRARAAQDASLVRNPHALLAVASHGNARAAALLIELGADVHVEDRDGVTPLHKAVHAGALDVVELLLAAGADVNRRERKWRGTPMSWSIVLHKPHIAQRLASISSDVRALAMSAQIARLESVLHNDPTLANHTLAGHDAPTPLFCLPDDDEAAAAVTRVLLAHGAEPSVRNPQGKTAEQAARFCGLDDAADLMASHQLGR